jgi:pSer/pThr/pTyr-binding forkhead associated (FHA) protein
MQDKAQMDCPTCGRRISKKAVICQGCGEVLRNLPEENTQTAIMSPPPLDAAEMNKLGGTGRFNEGGTIYLSIERVNSPITRYVRKVPIILGRQETGGLKREDVDLEPYRARERGVSRRHARIYAAEGQLYIEDLKSSNGTLLNGEALDPLTPYRLRDGDELVLGRMMVWINF